MQPAGSQITCPNCHRPFMANLEQIIDAGQDPQAKTRLLSGRTNVVTCPNCGYQSRLSTPLVYHDPLKELLLIFIPMELGLPQQEQNRLIGSLTNAIISSLPQNQRKGYLLTPKMMLTMQGMLETILEKDGITKEVLEAQRATMKLVEALLQRDPATLPDFVREHDSEINEEFFGILSASAESAIAAGRRDAAEYMLQLREQLLTMTTTGQALIAQASEQEASIQEVANALSELGEKADYNDLIDLAMNLAAEKGDEALQVLVGLARPAMDYQFFQTFTSIVEQTEDQESKDALTNVRDRLLELTSIVDQQNEQVVRVATETLRGILNSPDIDAAIQERVELLDDTFLAVLSANIQAAEQMKDIATAGQLKLVFDKVVALLRESAPPAIKFINDLMSQSFAEAQANLAEHAPEYGPELIQWIEMIARDLSARGNADALDKLNALRDEAIKVLAVSGMNDSNA
ncbi:MAG: CpXC domain-containing protein [Chloroflexota bacterium]